jgi:hypothetical protein
MHTHGADVLNPNPASRKSTHKHLIFNYHYITSTWSSKDIHLKKRAPQLNLLLQEKQQIIRLLWNTVERHVNMGEA